MKHISLINLLKYCLGYVRLTSRRSYLIQDKFAVSLDNDLFVLSDFLSRDSNETQSNKFIINLQHFYSLTPKDITKENERQYNREKQIAEKLEEIYNKYKNDEFTKQINLNFGFYEIELPEIEAETTDGEADDQLKDANLFGQQEIQQKAYRIERRPLFSLPVIIDREHGKYYLRPADSEIQYNVSILEPVLGEERLLQVVETFGQYEIEDKFALPINKITIFNELWGSVCEQLRLTNAVFGESSFKWDEFRISLSPKVNYFLVEDLLKLSRLDEDKLKMSSIAGWVDDDGLSTESNIPEEEELYFPLPYDKYQLKVLKLINNRASVVQGPPGTGKSQTIANILCHLAANGKRVLFVSQKAQALKVVKDKLNELKVNGKKLQYLYGSIPNLASPQIGENDELDGIAPQLAGLGPYLEKMEYGHHTASDVTEEIRAIVGDKKQICKTDSRYNDKSIGILTFFNLQAAYIRKILEEAGYTEENDIKVSIIDGIQGDEKDIVIYSFVLTSPDQKKRYVSLAGEGGEINKEIAAGRVNVAFSRARMQVHCVVSMPIEKFPEGIWIDKFLKYVDKHGAVNQKNSSMLCIGV